MVRAFCLRHNISSKVANFRKMNGSILNKTVVSLCLLLVLYACKDLKGTEGEAPSITDTLHYANKNGVIQLIQSDSSYLTIMENNEGLITQVEFQADYEMTLIENTDTLPFLWMDTGGIEWHWDSLFFHEFTSFGKLQVLSEINELYYLPFYQLNTPVSLKGKIENKKGGSFLNGVLLKGVGQGLLEETSYEMTGIISQIPYSEEYHSTEEYPQGIVLENETREHLVMEVIKYHEIEEE